MTQVLLRAYSQMLRLVRPNAGLTQLCFNPVVNALCARLDPVQRARFADGLSVEVDVQEYHGRILYLAGSGDWKVSRTVNALLRPGDALLDIGANYGSIGLAARAAVGSQGHVHLFEPQAQVAAQAAAAMEQGGVRNATLHRVALFDADGEMTLGGPQGHTGTASLMDNEDDPHAAQEIVEVRDTKGYVAPLVAGRSFGVKIDIEGAEPHVLPGLLGLEGLRFVVFEGASNVGELDAQFREAGFAIYGLVRSPIRLRLCRVDAIDDWAEFHDFVALPEVSNLPKGVVAPGALAKASA